MKLLKIASVVALVAFASGASAQEKSKESVSSKPVNLEVKNVKPVKIQKKSEPKQVKAKTVEAEPRTLSTGIKRKEAKKIEKVEK